MTSRTPLAIVCTNVWLRVCKKRDEKLVTTEGLALAREGCGGEKPPGTWCHPLPSPTGCRAPEPARCGCGCARPGVGLVLKAGRAVAEGGRGSWRPETTPQSQWSPIRIPSFQSPASRNSELSRPGSGLTSPGTRMALHKFTPITHNEAPNETEKTNTAITYSLVLAATLQNGSMNLRF